MGMPRNPDSRYYFRSAMQRFEDAEILLAADRTTGAVYLAGYSIECILKALILEALPASRRVEVMAEFRGAKAHNYDWLRSLYYDETKGPRFPMEVTEAFTFVRDWSSELRYAPFTIAYEDAEGFIEAIKTIIAWAKARL